MKRFSFFVAFAALLLLGRLTLHVQTAQAQTTPPPNVIITLTGDNFTRQSTVFIGTAQFTPEYVSPNTLRVSIPRSLLSSAQPNNVRVVNPSAGGGSSAALPLVVACRTAENPQLADFSMTMKTTTYSDLSEPMNEENLAEGQKLILSHSRMPYNSRTVMSGKYLRNGNAEVNVSFVPDADNPFAANPPSSSANSLSRVYMNSASGEATFYNAANQIMRVTPIDSVPFKPVTDFLRSTLLRLDSGMTATTTNTIPPPADSLIRKSIYLADAYQSGFPITQIAPGRYKIQYQRTANLSLPSNETIRIYVKSPEDYIERYEVFRDNRLEFRIRYEYDNPVPGKIVPRLRRTVSSTFYILEGMPLKNVTVNNFEEFTLNITQ